MRNISYVIKAIGDSKTLASARNLRGGVTTQIKAYDPAMFSVGEAGTLTLPAYSGRSEPRYARPLGEEIASQNALAFLAKQAATVQTRMRLTENALGF